MVISDSDITVSILSTVLYVVSEYDQDIPKSQTEDNPVAP